VDAVDAAAVVGEQSQDFVLVDELAIAPDLISEGHVGSLSVVLCQGVNEHR
jgi:hypothetical protein